MTSLANLIRRLSRPTPPIRSRVQATPRLEVLEDRCLLTAYTITTAKDLLGDHAAGEVTLRDVLTAINTQAGSGNAAAGTATNTVKFAIGAPGTVQTINVTAALPVLHHELFLDGWSQGGTGYTGLPLIVLNGSRAGIANGLTLAPGSDNSTVRGLVIQQFSSAGLELSGTSGDSILGNFIGTDKTGTVRLGNAAGVEIHNGATNNTVGGTASGSANLLSGNAGPGVEIKDGGTSGNTVLGNFIGTDKTGTVRLGNAAGVEIRSGATNNTVGGTASGSANAISGNAGPGVEIKDGGTSGNTVLGNFIGTDKTGIVRLGNAAGVEIRSGATNNTVGGITTGSGNVISGNAGPGVEIKDTGTSGNTVLGNLIGTDKTGTAKLGNGAGVEIRSGATNNTVGGITTGSGNAISGNAGPGVEIKDTGTSGNIVLGNFIGTDKTGTVRLGNAAGVEIRSGATNNTVGGTASGSANAISGNAGPGVEIKDGGTSGNIVLGNFIGTDKTGTVRLGNAAGVEIRSGATNNTVGGITTGSGNVISGNAGPGVEIKDTGTSGNTVLGNLIGTDKTGTANLGNTTAGVLLRAGAASNTIGGTAAGSGNTIAFNNKGVVVKDTAISDSIFGNSIWGNTGLGIDLGDDGPTANGPNPRPFANHGQNTPVISAQTTTSVSGSLTSVPFTTFRLEFFATPASGRPDRGQSFLGFLDVTTDAAGYISFTAPTATILPGSVVTATATNLTTGDTSEFSRVGA